MGIIGVDLKYIKWYADTVKNEVYSDYLIVKSTLQLREPLKIINKLAENGWEFVTLFQDSIQT